MDFKNHMSVMGLMTISRQFPQPVEQAHYLQCYDVTLHFYLMHILHGFVAINHKYI